MSEANSIGRRVNEIKMHGDNVRDSLASYANKKIAVPREPTRGKKWTFLDFIKANYPEDCEKMKVKDGRDVDSALKYFRKKHTVEEAESIAKIFAEQEDDLKVEHILKWLGIQITHGKEKSDDDDAR